MNAEQIKSAIKQSNTNSECIDNSDKQEIAAEAIDALWQIALQLAKIAESMPERSVA